MSRATKILLSGYLALGFLALRLLYALVFAGLSGNEVLFTLPEIRLSGPFAHVSLFGEVSVDGILRNLETAMPFALSILIFGIAASFVSAQNLRAFAKKVPPLRNLVNAIAIGLISLPALFDATRKVFDARALRSEKRSNLLVPILERSVELANSIGLKIALEPSGTHRAKKLSVSQLSVPDCNLGPIDLEISTGELIVLSGATGSGKSTLLEAISGILSEYRGRVTTGSVSFEGQDALSISEVANFLRYIPQNPRELLWGFQAHDLIGEISKEISDLLGIAELASKDTQYLSEGEALKLLLAENLAANPTMLLLDEPYAPLDAASREQLTKLLNDLAANGMAIVVVEHEPNHSAGLKARHLKFNQGRLEPGQYQPAAAEIVRTNVVVGNEVVITAALEDIGFDRVLIKAPKISIRQGERVWLAGDNGSGKTSLLRALVSNRGVLVYGQRPDQVAKLALVPENFDDFFVSDSLLAELARADKVARVAPGFTLTTLESILPKQDLSLWLRVHPRDLSRGTRLALAVAMQLSHKPQVLLVDEPFRGLDVHARELMVESLRCVAETGCALLFASHEQNWSATLASRKLTIDNQQLIESVEVSA
ncbi:MAG TPA: ATP-binding cassette domain-containing protein [Aquiluna sp.]